MHRIVLSIAIFLIVVPAIAQERESAILYQNSYDLAHAGQDFLVNEAKQVDFFMLGELHGEREIPDLLTSTWPLLYRSGYHHLAAEVSPWAATRLEFPIGNDSLKVEGLWTNREARTVHSSAAKKTDKVLWGCDMEEISLGELIKEFLQKNSRKNPDEIPGAMGEGYNRKLAPKLLSLLNDKDSNNKFRDSDLYQSIMITLKIDSARAFPESRLKAQLLREELMKRSFSKYYNSDPRSKVLLRFGRNHLHYGFDERGISTLGNFISEFSISKNLKCFNVATFAAGGECMLMGNTFSADERGDDLAFQFLSERAGFDATLFDLRPLRRWLHSVNSGERSDLQRRLLFWADSYDAIICFKSVHPR